MSRIRTGAQRPLDLTVQEPMLNVAGEVNRSLRSRSDSSDPGSSDKPSN